MEQGHHQSNKLSDSNIGEILVISKENQNMSNRKIVGMGQFQPAPWLYSGALGTFVVSSFLLQNDNTPVLIEQDDFSKSFRLEIDGLMVGAGPSFSFSLSGGTISSIFTSSVAPATGTTNPFHASIKFYPVVVPPLLGGWSSTAGPWGPGFTEQLVYVGQVMGVDGILQTISGSLAMPSSPIIAGMQFAAGIGSSDMVAVISRFGFFDCD
jgi:hypothetical protein